MMTDEYIFGGVLLFTVLTAVSTSFKFGWRWWGTIFAFIGAWVGTFAAIFILTISAPENGSMTNTDLFRSLAAVAIGAVFGAFLIRGIANILAYNSTPTMKRMMYASLGAIALIFALAWLSLDLRQNPVFSTYAP